MTAVIYGYVDPHHVAVTAAARSLRIHPYEIVIMWPSNEWSSTGISAADLCVFCMDDATPYLEVARRTHDMTKPVIFAHLMFTVSSALARSLHKGISRYASLRCSVILDIIPASVTVDSLHNNLQSLPELRPREAFAIISSFVTKGNLNNLGIFRWLVNDPRSPCSRMLAPESVVACIGVAATEAHAVRALSCWIKIYEENSRPLLPPNLYQQALHNIIRVAAFYNNLKIIVSALVNGSLFPQVRPYHRTLIMMPRQCMTLIRLRWRADQVRLTLQEVSRQMNCAQYAEFAATLDYKDGILASSLRTSHSDGCSCFRIMERFLLSTFLKTPV